MAADITSGITTINAAPGLGVTQLTVETAATADNTDTFTITLANYGISQFLGIVGFTHSTTDSVIITEDPTTSVTSGVLTVTVGGSTANKKRMFVIWGK